MRGGAIDSKWWYGVAGPALMEVFGFTMIGLIGATVAPSRPVDPTNPVYIVGLAFGLVSLLGIFLTPVFAYSAYRDAKAVRESAAQWDPNPWFWGVFALVAPLAGTLASITLLWFVAVPYLFRRFSTSTGAIASDDPEDASTDGEQWDATSPAAEGDNRVEGADGDIVHGGDAQSGQVAAGSQHKPSVTDRKEGKGLEHSSTTDRATVDEEESADESGPYSRWWYGITAGVFSGVVFYLAVIGIFAWLIASNVSWGLQPLLREMSGIPTLFVVGGGFAWLLTTPVFTVSMIADSRRLRSSDSTWQPGSLWHLVAVGHLAAIPFPMLAFITLPAGGVYLLKRRKYVGRP